MAFEGIRPVLHAPFRAGPDESVEHGELRALVEHVLAFGSDGLVVLGLATETWAIRESERDEILATVTDAAGGRVPLVVGIDGATQVAVGRARRAAGAGVSGLMVLPPGTAKSTAQLVAHYRAIADATGLPVLIQDSPQVTGVTLTIETLVSLRQADPLLGSLKVEVAGAGAKVSAAIAAGIEVIAGWGGLNYLESMRRGAVGCMPGCDLGAAILDIDRRWRSGDADGADAAYRRILPLLSYVGQSLDLLVLGSKRMLRRTGIFTSENMRQPSRSLDREEAATIDALLDQLALEGAPGF